MRISPQIADPIALQQATGIILINYDFQTGGYYAEIGWELFNGDTELFQINFSGTMLTIRSMYLEWADRSLVIVSPRLVKVDMVSFEAVNEEQYMVIFSELFHHLICSKRKRFAFSVAFIL